MYEVEIRKVSDNTDAIKKVVYFQQFHKIEVGKFVKELNSSYYVKTDIDLAQTILTTANALNAEYAKSLIKEPVKKEG